MDTLDLNEWQITNALIERLEAAIHSSGRVTAYPEVIPKNAVLSG
jgi:hypothetical protein